MGSPRTEQKVRDHSTTPVLENATTWSIMVATAQADVAARWKCLRLVLTASVARGRGEHTLTLQEQTAPPPCQRAANKPRKLHRKTSRKGEMLSYHAPTVEGDPGAPGPRFRNYEACKVEPGTLNDSAMATPFTWRRRASASAAKRSNSGEPGSTRNSTRRFRLANFVPRG